MDRSVYIVANKQQEHNTLKKFEQEGLRWQAGEKPTEWKPVKEGTLCSLPYALVVSSYVSWLSLSQLTDEEIVFDGRKESKMSEKYVVSQEFMNELEEWKAALKINGQYYVDDEDVYNLPNVIINWWGNDNHALEQNNRLIAIIRWVNGEDVFEIEKPEKWVVRSKEHDEGGHYQYVKAGHFDMAFNKYNIDQATRFNTKEEAESWANSHQEVIEVEG